MWIQFSDAVSAHNIAGHSNVLAIADKLDNRSCMRKPSLHLMQAPRRRTESLHLAGEREAARPPTVAVPRGNALHILNLHAALFEGVCAM